jgi:hypothetical protein
MGLLEPITHKEEIEKLLNEAKQKYDASLKRFESQKKKTTQSLEKLGEIKVSSWASSMDAFVSAFSCFKNVEIDKKIEADLHFIGSNENPQQLLINMQQASMTASEVAKAGFAAVGTGALVGIAAYGGAMMFASASTGTAIAALSGAAKTKATLAWFGGGAKAAGGLGIAGGKVVIAGIVILPILAVATVIAAFKGKEKLAEAKKINAEALEAVSKMDTVTTGMVGIEKMSNNYSDFIKKLNKEFAPFIRELERIKNKHTLQADGKIDFNSLMTIEQKTLHVTWLMVQLFYHVLSTAILTDQGVVSNEAESTLAASSNGLKLLRKDTFRMEGEETRISNLFWNAPAKKMMIINFAAMLILLLVGLKALSVSVVSGIMCFVGVIIAFPIFFIFRGLPASKLYVWRLIRLAVAAIFVMITTILFR